MAYTPIPTSTTGETWTAANHNTYIKANFAAGIPDIFTAKGDLAVSSDTDAASALAVGTDGQILKVTSSDTLGVAWGDDTVNDLVSNAGEMVVGSGADTLVALAAGSEGQILKSTTDANVVAWGSLFNYRQGGSATDWSNGTTTDLADYELTNAVLLLNAVSLTSIGVSGANLADFTEIPIVFVGCNDLNLATTNTDVRTPSIISITTTGITAMGHSDLPTSDGQAGINHKVLAIGAI